jgi:hypothetical protein
MAQAVTHTYRGVPRDVTTRDPADVIFSGQVGCPFYEDIRKVEESVAAIRADISRKLDTWNRVWVNARDNNDTHVQSRALNEMRGLHTALRRLELAVS